MAKVFDGKKFAQDKLILLESRVSKLIEKGVKPQIVVVVVGRDRSSWLYVDVKKRTAEGVSCAIDVHEFSEEASITELVDDIKKANENEFVHGVMVQLPLPDRIALSTEQVVSAIAREKDVDGLRADSNMVHPTAKAIYEIYLESGVHTGKVCVVGADGMVGRATIDLFKQKGVDVAGLDRGTEDIAKHTRDCDVLISATGQKGIIGFEMVKEGAVVIDVGSPRGDVDFEEVVKKASFITPVPGGVGPVTVSCLMENLVTLAERG